MFNQNKFSLERNVSLKKCSSFNIGGKVDFLIRIKNKKDLIEAIKEVKKNKFPFFILGGGTNVLFNDKVFKGVILKIENENIDIEKRNIIKTGAGTRLSKLVSFCLNNELSGLEWAMGIPGTIGGAVRGNAGAFNESIKDSILSVEVYNIKKNKVEIINKNKCEFNYRESLFKKKNEYVILEMRMKFKKEKKAIIEKKTKFYLKQRIRKQPSGFSAGSVFKNHEIKSEKEKNFFLKNYPEIEEIIKNDIVPAAFLVEKCGLKGKKIKEAMISEVHANFILNSGKAKSDDVKKLINIVKKEVKKKFKIVLEEEIVVIK